MKEDVVVGSHVYILAGGAAGTTVDIALFPLDSIKTRLQSEVGFKAAGGFQNIYKGIGPAALGSAPSAAAFFVTYESTKGVLKSFIPENYEFIGHASAASLGETASCFVRVPTEILKQRRQTSQFSLVHIFKTCLREEGFWGLYRGYWSTLMREIPFSFIQYPLWEFFKKRGSLRLGRNVNSWESAMCGALAGGISAAITTPLDVAKTRIMLAKLGTVEAEGNIVVVIKKIYNQGGIRRLYSGMIPRSLWMSLGGGVFFGAYEFTKKVLSEL